MVRTRLTPKVPVGTPLPTTEGGIDYDNVICDEIHGPLEFTIKTSTHRKHCQMLNIHHPYFEKDMHLFPWNLTVAFRSIPHWHGYRLNQAIAAEADYRFYKPAKVGDRLFGVTITSDKFELRGRHYLLLDDQLFNEHHELLMSRRGRVITMVGRGELPNLGERTKERRLENRWKGEAGAMIPNSPDLPVGTELPNHITSPSFMRISGHKEWDPQAWKKNIHGDEYARSLGYAGGVVEAPIVTEFALLKSMVDFFGPDQYFNTGRMHYKVTGPVYVGDVLIGKARIKERRIEGRYTRTILDVRVEKEDGSLCQVGIASALDRVPELED